MAIQVLVNGVDLSTKYVRRSLAIRSAGSQGIVTCDVSLIDNPAGAVISLEHVLRVLNGGTEVFEGKIKGRTRQGTPDPGPNPKKTYKVAAQDYTHLLTQDVIDTTLIRTGSGSDKTEVEFLITTYGSKGITVGTLVQNTGTIGRDIDYSGMNLYEALEEATKWMGTAFYVDSNLQLHWFVSEANAAPFNLSDVPNNTTTFGYRDLDISDDTYDLANAVWVIGASGMVGWRTNATSIGLYGRIETTIRDDKITTTAQRDTAGDGYLAKNAYPEAPIHLTTFKDGLAAGMTVQITNALYGLVSVTYRIEQVTGRHNGDTDTMIYTVDLNSRPVSIATLFDSSSRQAGAAAGAATAAAGAVGNIIVDLSVAGANLVQNSSFEDPSSFGWTVGGVWTFGFAVADAYAGAEVSRLVAIGATTGELVTTNFIPVAKSDFYWVSAWSFLRSRTAGIYKMFIREYSAAGTLLATTTLPVSAVEAEWTRRKQQFGPNAQAGVGTIIWNASTTKIKVGFFADTTPTGTWDVDGLQVERGKLITAYAPTPQELIDGSIVGSKIAAAAVALGNLAPLSVDATKITAGAVTTPKIAANAVTANEIAALTITAAQIAASAITTVKLNALAVDATKIAANAIVAGKIAAGTVTAAEIAALTITAAEIAASAIDATKIVANSITADRLAFGGGFGNLLMNGSFEDASAAAHSGYVTTSADLMGWDIQGSALVSFLAGSGRNGLYRALVQGNGAVANPRIEQYVPVVAGAKYRLTGWMWHGSTLGNSVAPRANVATYDANKVLVNGVFAFVSHSPVTSVVPAFYSLEFTIPSDGTVSYARIDFRLTSISAVSEIGAFDDWTLTRVPTSLANEPSEVLIDKTGIAVTNGKITVTNPGSTVIIDGTSDMFRIAASGTRTATRTGVGNVLASTTVGGTSLPVSDSPAFISYITEGTAPLVSGNRNLGWFFKMAPGFVAPTSGAAATNGAQYVRFMMQTISSSGPAIHLSIDCGEAGLVAAGYMRWYLLQQAAI